MNLQAAIQSYADAVLAGLPLIALAAVVGGDCAVGRERGNAMRLMAHPVHATPLPEPRRSWPYRVLELAVLVAGIGVVLAVITVFGRPL